MTAIDNNRLLPTVAVIMACLLAAAFVLAAQPPGAAELTDKGARDLPETQRDDGPPATESASTDDAPELTDKGSRDLSETQQDDGPPATESASTGGAPELTAKASRAIDKGLKFLLANQRADGSWASTEAGDRAVAITSLALMAFMSRAEFPGYGPNGDALNRAKDWLLARAKETPDGFMGATMYEHGLAILALTEMWGMTRDLKGDDDDAMQEAIKAGVEVIIRSQSDGGGWRYQPTPNAGHDTSVTVMVFIALASARQAGVVVPNVTITKVVKYFESATSQKSGGFNYIPTGTAKNDSIACTGGGAYAAQLAGERDSEMVKSALRFLKERSPGIINNNFGHYYYGHYYAIHAMVQAGDDHYAKWYPLIRDALIRKQNAQGAWPGKASGAKAVGYETPMAIIILATPHRYIPIYQR